MIVVKVTKKSDAGILPHEHWIAEARGDLIKNSKRLKCGRCLSWMTSDPAKPLNSFVNRE